MSDSKDTVVVTKDGSAGWFVAVIAIAALLGFANRHQRVLGDCRLHLSDRVVWVYTRGRGQR